MKFIDTPAGKFQIFLNGLPIDFHAETYAQYAYHDKYGLPVQITACLEVSIPCKGLAVGDIIIAQYEHGALSYDGGGENVDNAVGTVGDYVVGIGCSDTQYLESQASRHWLPYEEIGLNGAGFEFRIVDDPNKLDAHPLQQKISFIIAWESNDKEYARDIVSLMTS